MEIESRAHDGRIGRPLAAPALEFILHQSGNFVFPHARLYRLHGGKVRFHRCVHGLANQGDFSRTLHRAHAPDDQAEVRKRGLGRLVANLLHHLRLEAFFAALGLRRELGVNLGKTLERFLEVGGKLRDVANRRKSRAGGSVSVVRRQLGPCPFLFRAVVRRNIQDLFTQFRRGAGRMSLRHQQHDGSRLVPAGEVVELLVLPEGRDAGRHIRLVDIRRARSRHRRPCRESGARAAREIRRAAPAPKRLPRAPSPGWPPRQAPSPKWPETFVASEPPSRMSV